MNELTKKEKEMLVRRTFPEKQLLNLDMLLYPEKPVEELIKKRVKGCSSSPFALSGTRDNVAETISLSKKEGIEIATEMAKNNALLTSYFSSITELLEHDPTLLFHIPQEMRTEEYVQILFRKRPRYAPMMQGLSFATKKIFAESMEDYTFPKGLLDDCTDNEIMELILINPDVISTLPEDRYTKDILYCYLEQMVKRNLKPYVLKGYGNKVPEELRDKIYWRSMCMVSGYCYSLVPKEKREEYITEKIVDYTLEHEKDYVGYVWMAQFMPEKLKTPEIMKRLVKKHPYTAQYLPKNLKNDEFYKELGRENPEFIEHIDFKTASSETLATYMGQCTQLLLCDEKIPKDKWSNELALAIARCHNNFSIIPKDFQTREVAEKFLTYHAGLDQIPSKLQDEELYFHALKNNHYSLKHIPEEKRTDVFWERCKKERLLDASDMPEEFLDEEYVLDMISMGRIYSFEQIPRNFRTAKVTFAFATYQTRNRIIPVEYQTKEIVKELYDHWTFETPYAEAFFWSKIRKSLRDEAALERLAEKVESSIDILLTKEQIDKNLAVWPENILFAPKWYLDKYVRNIDAEIDAEEISDNTAEVEAVSEKEVDTSHFEQLTIWDLLTA